MHLVIDGHNGDRQRLQDPDIVYRFLDEYPDGLGMTKITPPHVYTYHGPQPGDWGVSGFVLIAESHISVHTFPDRGYINIDVFSCKEFDPNLAREQITETFGIGEVKHWLPERGLEYADTDTAFKELEEDRSALVGKVS